uniref:Uncharacterized protein n=1 Tax=Molossus molossus TaxID=27622 RepID=A0A7J8FRY7_MOLMO|nr:hypothetical protein HJG59_008401 [Molossus molossus]
MNDKQQIKNKSTLKYKYQNSNKSARKYTSCSCFFNLELNIHTVRINLKCKFNWLYQNIHQCKQHLNQEIEHFHYTGSFFPSHLSLMINDTEHLFTYLLAIHMSVFVKFCSCFWPIFKFECNCVFVDFHNMYETIVR